CGEKADSLGLDRLTQKHVFACVGQADEGDHGSALRLNLDQTFGLEARQSLRHRKAGYAEAFAKSFLIKGIAWLKGERDYGCPQRFRHSLGSAAATLRADAAQCLVRFSFRRHTNM